MHLGIVTLDVVCFTLLLFLRSYLFWMISGAHPLETTLCTFFPTSRLLIRFPRRFWLQWVISNGFCWWSVAFSAIPVSGLLMQCITHLSYSCETFSHIHFIPIIFRRTRFCHAIKLPPAVHVLMACRRWSNGHLRLCCRNCRTDIMMADVNDGITNDHIINNNYNMMDSYWLQSRFVFWHYADPYFGHACPSFRILNVCVCKIGGLMRIRMELDPSLVCPVSLVLAHFFRVYPFGVVVGVVFPIVASVACSCLLAQLFPWIRIGFHS